jgi:hypothetical protein
MLIDQFNKFLIDVSQWPSAFWVHKFYSARKFFIRELDEIKLSFQQTESQSYKNIETLIFVFNQDINELNLAEAIQIFALDFAKSDKKDEKIELFIQLANNFLKRAQLFDSYQRKRDALNLDAKQKEEFDQKLFADIGVFYCLEYYLAIYKQLSDLVEKKEKEDFFNSKEINLGFGKLPGLRADFLKDEVLEKFILLLLNNTVRDRVLISYYVCKNFAIAETVNIVEFEKVFKKFIYYLLLSFQENQVHVLSSTFFKPYGDQPEVKNLISIFESYE